MRNFKQKVMNVVCPRCDAGVGDGCITAGGNEASTLHAERRERARVIDQRDKTKKQTLTTTPDEATLFRYEIYYIWQAAQNVRDKPAKDMVENMGILDEKIKLLSNRIEDVFGKLADEREPG